MKGITRWVLVLLAAALGTGALAGGGWWLGRALTWQHPTLIWMLFLTLPFSGLLILAWYLRRRATRRFGDPATARSLIAGRSGVFRAIRGALLVAGLALVAISLAGPQYGTVTRVLRKRGVDVVVALDFSKSMLACDVRPDRIRRAKAELMRFIEELDGDRVGIVAFAGETMEFPMTMDYSAIGLYLRDLGPYDLPVGGTAIGRALTSAKRLLERSSRVRDPEERSRQRAQVVILFTDGEDHEGDPVEAARDLAAQGIKVYVVGIGSRTPEPIPTYTSDGTWTGYLRDEGGELVTTALTAENEAVLEEIATVTGGRFFKARQGGVGVDQIRREMRRMKQEEHRARRITLSEDRYALVLLPAFFLIVLESLLPDAFIGRRRRRRDEDAKEAR